MKISKYISKCIKLIIWLIVVLIVGEMRVKLIEDLGRA